jgi:hypothetical protein
MPEYTFKLDSSKFTVTPEGFLDCVGACARIGNQTYSDDGKPFIEFRPEEEVFSKDSLESHKFKPITFKHPDSKVDSENFSLLTVGFTGSNPRREEDFVLNDFKIMDKATVEGILARRDRGESTEISMGYDRVLDRKVGDFRGKKYDGIQRNIRINHAALLHQGEARAGMGAKLRFDNGNKSDQLALYLLDKRLKENKHPLQAIVVDKKIVETDQEARKIADEFGKFNKIAICDETGKSFRFPLMDHKRFKEKSFETFPVPGKQGVSLVFGTLKDEGNKKMPNLKRKAITVGTFRMDDLEGKYHEDSETIIKALTTKLDEAIEVIKALCQEAKDDQGDNDKLQAKIDELEKENKKLTTDVTELSDVNSDRVQKMISDRAELEAVAGCFKIDCKGKTDLIIKDAVILADDKDYVADGKSEDYKQARYDGISLRAKQDQKAFDSSKQSFGEFRKNVQDAKGTEKKDAQEEFKKKSADAYKGKEYIDKKYNS